MKRLILLADDSPTIQRLVTQTFTGSDFEVFSVSNGDAAIKKFEEVRPDIVLADIYMPGRNGYEVCAAVKKHPELGDTPVLLLAGAFDAYDDETASQVGAADHITKPFEPQALVNLVSTLVPKGTGRDRPPLPQVAPPLKREMISPLPSAPLAATAAVNAEQGIPMPAPPVPEPRMPESKAIEPQTAEPAMPSIQNAVPAPASAPAGEGDLLGLRDLFKAPAPAPATVSDAEIDRIATIIMQKLSAQVIENVAWDVVPDITTKVLKEELKRQS